MQKFGVCSLYNKSRENTIEKRANLNNSTKNRAEMEFMFLNVGENVEMRKRRERAKYGLSER